MNNNSNDKCSFLAMSTVSELLGKLCSRFAEKMNLLLLKGQVIAPKSTLFFSKSRAYVDSSLVVVAD